MILTLGPIDVAIIEFKGNQFKDEIIPALAEVVEQGIIRIIDLTFIKKDADGKVSTFELDTMDADIGEAMDPITDDVMGLLSEEDIQQIGAQMAPKTSGAMLVIEHVWAENLMRAITSARGRLVAQMRIPHEVVEEALQARSENR